MLENDQIRLRALEPSDVDKLYSWENNPNNWKVSHTITPFSKHVLSEYIQHAGDIYSDKQLRLLIERCDTSTPIGAVDLFDCDFKNKRVGVGILVAGASDRNLGYGSNTLELLIPYCFEMLGLHQMYCNILAENVNSLILFEKFGFVKVGLKREWTVHNGVYHDEWLLQKIAGQ